MSAQEQFDRYLRFLEIDPNNLRLLTDISNCAYDIGRLDDVLTFTTRGLKLDPGNRELRAIRALASLSLGKTEEALLLLQQLVDEGEQDPGIRYNLAYCLALHNQYQRALELLADAEHEWQNIPQMAHLKIKTLHFLGEVQQAIELGERVIKLHPEDAVIHGLMSALYIDTSNFELAKQHAEQALQGGNAIPEAYASLGTLALSDQDDTHALAHFEHAIQLKPNSGRAWLGKGMAEMLQNNMEPAQKSIDSALQYMPNHLGTWQALAWCQIARQDLDGAEATIKKALAIDDTFAESHGVMAIISVLRGNLDQARESIRRALGLDRQSYSGLFAQALLLKQQGRAETSQKLIDGMLDTPILPDQRTLRAVLIKQMGKSAGNSE